MKIKKIKIKLTLFAAAVFFLVLLFQSHPADAATINAASCSQEHVQAAVTSAVAGDTVIIPTGSCTWSGTISISKAITIQGAGPDRTHINQSATTSFQISNVAARITGIDFIAPSGSTHSGVITYGRGWRIDHCRFEGSSYAMSFRHTSSVRAAGLIDNCEFYNARVVALGNSSSMKIEDEIWAADAGLGTGESVYLEDCTFEQDNTGNTVDANYAGQFVVRFSTIINTDIDAHSYHSAISRGTRSWEIYENEFISTRDDYFKRPIWMRAGEGVIFDNVITGKWRTTVIQLDSQRAYEPLDMGLCDGTAVMDGNEPGQNGWLCRDQPGAGKDKTLTTTSGSWPDTVVNWADQTNSPVYAWRNSWPIGLNLTSGIHVKENRDFYDSHPWTAQTSPNSPFNGTSGTGYGTMANRPDTCTAGVGYWATDAPNSNWNTANGSGNDGALYKCIFANNWLFYYKPYIYPHPLRTGETPPACTPSCSGKQCGDDGCGGSCGACLTGQACVNYQCQSAPAAFIPGQTIEAEAGILSSPMRILSDTSAVGGAVIESTLDNQGSARYAFQINTAGRYILRARTKALSTGVNSFFVGLDSEPAANDQNYYFDIPVTTAWTWTNVSKWGSGSPQYNPMVYDLSVGSHALTFYSRERNTLLDQIRLEPYDSQAKTGDLNSDGRVDVQDIGILLSNWGSTSRPSSDLNQNGTVDVVDLGILLGNWGS